MASLKIMLIVFMVLIALSMDGVNCLKCFTCLKCDGKGELKECGSGLKSTVTKEVTKNGITNKTVEEGPETSFEFSCYKIEVEGGDYPGIARSCMPKQEEKCETVESGKVKGTVCFCNTDECNGAGELHGWTSVQISIVSLLTFFAASIVSFTGGQ